MRSMSFSAFVRKYQPLRAPQSRDSDPGIYTYEQASKYKPEQVWSVLDCDGKQYLSPGFRVVNCTGQYFVCAVEHGFTLRDVKYN